MTAAAASATLTVNENNKSLVWSDTFAHMEQISLTIVTATGNTWPDGTYSLALTYHERTVTLAECTWLAGALTCTLSLATADIEDIFDALTHRCVVFDATLWDATAKKVWGRGRLPVYRADYTDASADPTQATGYYTGAAAITIGEETVAVDLSGYNLAATPTVIATVTTPAGGDVILCAISDVTAAGFTAILSASPAVTGYKLNWIAKV